MAQANLGHVRDSITGIEVVSGTEGQPGNVTYKVTTEINPAGVGTFVVHNGSDVYEAATDGADIAHHSGEAPSKIYYYQDGSGNYRVAQNGFKDTAGTYSPNVRVTNMTTGLSYVAHYGTGAVFDYNEDLDVPAYIQFDRTKYNDTTAGYESSICSAAYAYYKSLPSGQYQKAYEAQGYHDGHYPDEKWLFTGFIIQSSTNKPTLYGYHSNKGFFEAWKNDESDASWNIAYNAPQKLGPFDDRTNIVAALDALAAADVATTAISMKWVKYDSVAENTYTRDCLFEYIKPDSGTSTVYISYFSQGSLAVWNESAGGEIYIIVDSAER